MSHGLRRAIWAVFDPVWKAPGCRHTAAQTRELGVKIRLATDLPLVVELALVGCLILAPVRLMMGRENWSDPRKKSSRFVMIVFLIPSVVDDAEGYHHIS